MGEVVYHYCDMDAFLGIISNSTLWMSDVTKSNDYQEYILCRDEVYKGVRNRINYDVRAVDIWDKFFKLGKEAPLGKSVFCTSFSEGENQLSQWREYANKGQGVAIGFDKNIFDEFNQNSEYVAFDKVVYNKTEYIERIISECEQKLKIEPVSHVATELFQNYDTKYAFYKNEGFVEEREWRAVICRFIDGRTVGELDKMQFSRIKYRTTDGKLIPYIELSFEKIKEKMIKEVWLGPRSKVEIGDIFNLLKFYGYYDGIGEEINYTYPIKICKSQISYR